MTSTSTAGHVRAAGHGGGAEAGGPTGEAYVREWVHGWVVSRAAAPPEPRPWGWWVTVGLPQHVGRYVFGGIGEGVREEDVRAVTAAPAGRGTQLKIVADPARVTPWFAPGWECFDGDDWFMARDLGPADTAPGSVPDGYRLASWTRADVTRVVLTTATGDFAAHGQVGVCGPSAAVDQIETAEAHQRRGLGAYVMRHLHAAARAAGAERAVLACTPAGRKLYTTVGWRDVSPFTHARYVGTRD
ncbi:MULTISPECIES: GNAT family N-acetyltransferase [unclassified Streptomyces]|uniref:GNAT family N-acetyltransferase n=1 Tax=unclassified Streptomyces TaxID=2593676 RepID=UPI000BAC6045|nr:MULTISPECIES: GNAT family N-acetyltransferase [unclassified Streptomyces]ASY34189.1 GNAT family N-acetyltransferase [Streptomyces sp. CLI2509]MYX20469.1 GNAT family N-acetyltransferase [Streptomyces sp. SID8380]